MALKEFAARQGVKQLLPLLGRMSDKNVVRFFWLVKKAAPNEFTKSFIDAVMKQPQTIELLRRAFCRIT